MTFRIRPLASVLVFCFVGLFAASCGSDSTQLKRSQARQEKQMAAEDPAEAAEKAKEEADSKIDVDVKKTTVVVKGGDDGDKGGDAKMAMLSDADLDKARGLFATCGGCHTLKDAGTSGASGPSLDETKFTLDEIKNQIENGGGAMPGGLMSGDDADLVAAYVAQMAAESQK